MRRYQYTVTDIHGRCEAEIITKGDMGGTIGLMIDIHERDNGSNDSRHILEALITDQETTWSVAEIREEE